MTRGFSGLVLLCLLASGASAALAQRPEPEPVFIPPANAVVRAWQANRFASPRFYWGRLVSLTPDSVVIHSTQLGRPIALDLDSVARLEYSIGREPKTRNLLLGAGIGSVVGAPLFVAALVLVQTAADSPTGVTAGDYVFVGTIGAFAGAGAGTMIGAMVPARRMWQPIPVMPSGRP